MRKLFPLGILALVCCGALAQQTSQAPMLASESQAALAALYAQKSPVHVVGINGQDCPIMVSARRGSGGGAVVQTNGNKPAEPVSQLKLRFSAQSRSGVSEATIFLHGTDARPRAELVNNRSLTAPEMTEVVHLTGSADHALTSASVNPARVVNVRWIGISELKFVDGTTWHSSETSYCRIEPNGFQLVSATE